MADTVNNRWQRHPVLARALRVLVVVVPFAVAMAVAFVLSSRLPIAGSTELAIARWIGIVAVSTLAMTTVDRFARRLLPLSTLLNLTLLFPDQAPSRFRIALRTGTTSQLRKKLDAAQTASLDETPSEAAERLLELVGLLSQHDRLTRGHSERVRAYTHLVGEEMGLSETELDKIRWAGLLHDVGKTAIDTDILNKPSRLTDEEFEVIKRHPTEGKALVAPLADWLGESLRAVWEHHERFDGGGYPAGLAGTDISTAARIVSVADAYDVMTSARSYKKPMSATAARAELARNSGSQFDPMVVRSFLNISLGRLRLMTGPIAWFAQLTLFGPPGVAHAGQAANGSSTTATGAGAATSTGSGAAASAAGATTATTAGTAATTVAATAATTTTAAATTAVAATTAGASGFVASAAIVTAGVAASAAGLVAADGPPAEQPEFAVTVETTQPREAIEPLGPPDTVEIDLSTGAMSNATTTTTTTAATPGLLTAPVPSQPGLSALPAGSEEDSDTQVEPATPSAGSENRATPSAGNKNSATPSAGGENRATPSAASENRATPSAGNKNSATPSAGSENRATPSAGSENRATPSAGNKNSATPSAGSENRATPSAGNKNSATPSAGSENRATPSAGNKNSATPSAGNKNSATPLNANQNRATPPAPPVPATTTTTVPPQTTTTTTVPEQLDGPRLHLGALFGINSFQLPFHRLTDGTPPDVALPNYDVNKDDAPGRLVRKDAAGIAGTSPDTVVSFSAWRSRDIVNNVHLHLFAAAKDFERSNITIEAGLYRCRPFQWCELLDSDLIEYRNADSFSKKVVHFKDAETKLHFGDRLELRLAVTDQSETDAWIVFGTNTYNSHLHFVGGG